MQAEIRLTVTFAGVTPLVMCNGAMADAESELSQAIKAITDKGSKMTAEDRTRKDRLQWRGELYTDPAGTQVVIPQPNIARCLANAGKATRNGTDVIRAVSFPFSWVPLTYDGPDMIDKLADDPAFTWRAVANLSPTKGPRGGKGAKVWPCFDKWALTFPVILYPDLLDLERFTSIVENAGIGEGIGDARRLGKGRFTGTVAKDTQ